MIIGRQWLIVTDILGLLLVVLVVPASVHDRNGAKKVLLELRHRRLLSRTGHRVRHVFADGGFAGTLVDWARAVDDCDPGGAQTAGQKGFAVIPRRRAVERMFGWLIGHRRLACDYERHPATRRAVLDGGAHPDTEVTPPVPCAVTIASTMA